MENVQSSQREHKLTKKYKKIFSACACTFYVYSFMYGVTNSEQHVWMIMHGRDVAVGREDGFGKNICVFIIINPLKSSYANEVNSQSLHAKELHKTERSGEIYVLSLVIKINYERICIGGINLRSYQYVQATVAM